MRKFYVKHPERENKGNPEMKETISDLEEKTPDVTKCNEQQQKSRSNVTQNLSSASVEGRKILPGRKGPEAWLLRR